MVKTIYGVIKAHSGEIKVETQEGDGAVFRILFLNAC